MSDRVEYYPKFVTRIAQIAFSQLITAFGIWLRQDHANSIARTSGLLITLIGVGLGIRLLVRLRDRSPRIVLDDIGLYDRMLGTPLIPWKDIAAAKIVPFYGSAFIGILPIDEAERISQFSIIRRLGVFSNSVFGLPALCINPNGLDAPTADVCREIWRRLEEVGHSQE